MLAAYSRYRYINVYMSHPGTLSVKPAGWTTLKPVEVSVLHTVPVLQGLLEAHRARGVDLAGFRA